MPIILQLNDVECGLACLAMIVSYHGQKTSLSACREFCATGRDGLTAQGIAKAARLYGLQVKAYSVTELDSFKHVPLPAIAHWGFNHFVVVEKWSTKTVTIVDPASGRQRLSKDDFSTSFTGVVLTFKPGPTFKAQTTESPPPFGQNTSKMF